MHFILSMSDECMCEYEMRNIEDVSVCKSVSKRLYFTQFDYLFFILF